MIVLAAGQGSRLRPLTDDRPKALVPFLGRPLLDWTIGTARENGLTEVVVVGGYRFDRLPSGQVQVLNNREYATTSMISSLMVAEEWFGDGFVMSYGDIVYRPEVLRALLASTAEIGVVVDLDWQQYWERRFGDPLQDAESLRMTPDGTIRSIGQTVSRLEDVQAQYIGLVVFRGRGVKALKRAWVRAKTDAAYRRPILGHRTVMAKLTLTDVLDELAVSGDVPVKAIPIHGGWVDIDRPEDLPIGEERWRVATTREVIAEAPAFANPVGAVPAQAGALTAGVSFGSGGSNRSFGSAGPGGPGGPGIGSTAGAPAPLGPLVAPTIFRSSRRW